MYKNPKNEKKYRVVGYHDLAEVKKKIKAGQFVINDDVLNDARLEFGWNKNDILYAYSKLKPEDCCDTDHSKIKYLMVVDTYEANIRNEDIYTHFYINAGMVIINSFHKPPKSGRII